MAVGFGFSVGDLIAVGKLAHEIANALNDCRGASAEYRSLIELLESLKTSLNLIGNFISTLPVTTSSRVDQAFMNGILFHAGCCYKLLNEFAADSRKYTQSLLNGKGARAKIAFRKIKWSLYSAEDSRRLEGRLGTHMEAFDRYLLVINIQTETNFAEESRGQVNQISVTVAAIYDTVQTTQKMMPKILGYSWEGDIVSSHVHIEDVLDTMRIMFSDHPGLKEVVDGNFELVDKQNQLTIFDGRVDTPQTKNYRSPSDAIQPGAKLLMNILRIKIIHAPRDSLAASVQALETCPRCGFATPGRRFRKCGNCDTNFKKSVRELLREPAMSADVEDWPNDPLPRTILNPPPIDYAPTKPPNADMETEYFRRVHEIAVYSVPSWYYSYSNFGRSRLPLIQAVGQGDLHWVRQILLKTDTDPDTRDYQGWTALQQACSIKINSPESRNQEAIVRLLISQGADVNAAGDKSFGKTALQATCYSGNERIVDLLLEKGAEVNENFAPVGGQSPLVSAVWAGHLGIVKKLLNLGADINQPGSEQFGHTALSAAAKQNNLKMLDFLIANGARTQESDVLFALRMALYHDSLDTARRLLEQNPDVNSCANGPAPLHSVKSIVMLNLLVTHGARFDVPGSEASGPTALQWAAQYGSLDLVTELVRLGSDVHRPGKGKNGRSVLQAAASRYKYEVEESVRIMSFLVEEHGADVNEPRSEEEGYTSIEAACHATVGKKRQRSIDSVKFLVEKGAVITPFTLHVAAAWNHTELLDFLLQNGARVQDISSLAKVLCSQDPNCSYCKFGPTVLETARLNGHMALAEALENWSPATQLKGHSNEGDSG
ncbi:ankyrin [Alternaria alternata]|nr:ankyrin [Alternaria alternata]